MGWYLMPFRSIRAHMTAGFFLAISIYLIVAWIGLAWYAKHVEGEETDRLLEISAARIKVDFSGSRSNEDFYRLLAQERAVLGDDQVTLALIRHGGKSIGIDHQGDVERARMTQKGWQTRIVRTERDVFIIGTQLKPWARLKPHLWVLLTFSSILMVLAAVGSWVLVGRTLSPLTLLTYQANAASAENLRIHLQEPSDDSEIVQLVATLNKMLARLADTAEVKGRFYSAASHELRTPLQALSGHLELALCRDRSKDNYRQVIEEAYRQTRRLIVLVEDLLLLYRLQSNTSQPQLHSEDLAVVCRQTLELCQPLIEQCELRVLTDLPQHAEFYVPSMHAHVLIRNLLENAAKYANKGSELSIRLSVGDRQINLRIFNQYTGPAFYDCVSTDNIQFHSDYQKGGTGLGLSICQAIATDNSWKLNVECQTEGVCATLTIDLHDEISDQDAV